MKTLISNGSKKGSKTLYQSSPGEGDGTLPFLIYKVTTNVKNGYISSQYVIGESELLEALDEWIENGKVLPSPDA